MRETSEPNRWSTNFWLRPALFALALTASVQGQEPANPEQPLPVETKEVDSGLPEFDVGLDAWTVPDEPDPSAIYESMTEDQRAGRHATALAKAEWYWEHALEFERAQVGVRLSFFLGDWFELAADYAPARGAILRARGQALRDVVERVNTIDSFTDFVSLNERLGDTADTINLYEVLREEDPALEPHLWRVAGDALLTQERYELWAEGAQPAVTTSSLMMSHNYMSCRGDEHHQYCTCVYADRSFLSEAGQLVGVLVLTGRDASAEEVAETLGRFGEEHEVDGIQSQLTRALAGELSLARATPPGPAWYRPLPLHALPVDPDVILR